MAGRKRKIEPVAIVEAIAAYAEVDVLPDPVRTNGKPHDHRCRHCGRLLCRAILKDGSEIEIRCPRCSHMNVWAGGSIILAGESEARDERSGETKSRTPDR